MIKFQVIAQRQPSLAGVAVLTRHFYRPVRILVWCDDAGCLGKGARRAPRPQHRSQQPVSMSIVESPGQNHSLRVIWLSGLRKLHRERNSSIAFIADRGDHRKLLHAGSSLSGFVVRIVFGLTGTQDSLPTGVNRWVD